MKTRKLIKKLLLYYILLPYDYVKSCFESRAGKIYGSGATLNFYSTGRPDH